MSTVVRTRSKYRSRHNSPRDRLREGERMLHDKAMGMTLVQLMDKYELSKPTVVKRLDEALAARIATTVDAYREQQNAVLDNMMQRHERSLTLADRMLAAGAEASDLSMMERATVLQNKALDGMTRVLERRAKLNGLDAPVQAVTQVVEVTQADLQLQAQIREAQARAQAETEHGRNTEEQTGEPVPSG